MIYHVSLHGSDSNAGTKEAPFRTINCAAAIAAPGDTVQVHEGTYREWVDPKCGGLNEQTRMTYEAAPGEHVVIKGSEVVTDWERVEGGVWRAVLPNSFFGDYNPYADVLAGDWIRKPHDDGYDVHTGDIYINGASMFEASSMEDLYKAEMRAEGYSGYSSALPKDILHPEQTVYRWYAQVDDGTTVIFGNFQDKDPNTETVEINVRPCCFFPRRTGLNYITVRGFEMAHAACQWAPPTAEQIGMVGPHWAKGWIIEDCHLHDAKCCAISIGKEGSTGQNFSYRFGRKSGHRYQAEAIFAALNGAGWSKDNIGSHMIRNNVIHDCGQCGIVGNLGGVFSRIEHNHIYNIGRKREFWGHEMAGIKLHAAIDVVIVGNNIHDTNCGTWLDWQAQGTRVTRNLYYKNDRADVMVEVTHGPCTIDNNLLLSDYAIVNHAQGTAFVHNVMRGAAFPHPVFERATPYHLPHSTAVMGYMAVYGGDDRLYNNLFFGKTEATAKHYANFSQYYDPFSTPEEYEKLLEQKGYRSLKSYTEIPQPVWIAENVYTGYAQSFRAEKDPLTVPEMSVSLDERDGKWILTMTVPQVVADKRCVPVTTQRLGTPRITEERYENPDGTPIDFMLDFFGNCREGAVIPGPFATLRAGENCFVVWH
ncbi:MAG: right-handed parallel beta-helix repeat-containing protein [Clostridia bacterium]|nr:right-handed parallel beta-helix repeat-containing protein [Clostridia bacterium]